MKPGDRVFVAGHRGLVGSAIVRALKARGFEQILCRGRDELDLTDRDSVRRFFSQERPEYVFLAAARVGGILANSTRPVEFLLENLKIQNNVIEASYDYGIRKLAFLGSSCIYPKMAPQPISEEHLLSGPLEPTNDAYAIAKIAGIKLCQSYQLQYGARFISLMPTNIYGPFDNFDLESSHVLPALLRKFHEAKVSNVDQVVVWGTGKVYREFLHSDDLAEACLFLMKHYDSPEIVNVGTGQDLTIRDLVEKIAGTVGYRGEVVWDSSRPDGTPRKQLNINKLKSLGWQPRICLDEGLASVYRWFNENYESALNRNLTVC